MVVTLFLFGVFAVTWFCVWNRYTVLYYQEQIQLFRFDRFYFLSFLDRPGGLCEYLGAFLTQFCFYPFAGAIILTAVLITFVLLFYDICRFCCNIGQMFFIPFIPAVLLMTSFVNMFFGMPEALALLFVLAGFRWYIVIIQKSWNFGVIKSWIFGMILVTATYFIAGGNALLLTALIIIYSLTNLKISKFKNFKITGLCISGILFWVVLLPWLSGRLFYVITLREAYFALTPFLFIMPTMDMILLWLSLPILFLIFFLICVQKKHAESRWNLSSLKMGVFNFLIVFVMTACCAYTMYDRGSGHVINRMTFELQHGNFDTAIKVGKENPKNNRLVCYLTNIAIYESGQMPYLMFHYKQMGTAGLFLDWGFANASSIVWYLGEVYYRLGLILPAEHCTFEALVSSHKGPDAKVLQRLALTNIARRDSATAEKYLRYLDNSLFYRNWAREQRTNLASVMRDVHFHIPGTPKPVRCKDFFIPYQMPEYTLLMLLESNPKHRMAFEYLMAYCMLQKDIEKVKWSMDNYYRYMDYPAIPTHYEEALLLYENVFDEVTGYRISNVTRERYEHYMQTVKAAQGNKRKFEQFRNQFSNTFWYYMNLIDPAKIKNSK